MILNFLTDGSGQTVQTQIRLLLEEQSDQGLHCLLFHLHLFDEIHSLRKHSHMFYTPSFTLLYSRKGEMRGTQNEDLFSGLD